MKCNKCDFEKSDLDFSFRSKVKNIRHKRCKDCVNQYRRATYSYSNKITNSQLGELKCKKCKFQKAYDEFYAKRDGTGYSRMCKPCHAARKLENLEFIRQYKSERPCVDCNKKYHYCQLDFDHLEKKSYNVSSIYHYSRAKLLAEIGKCEIVCSNCHRLRTFYRLQELSDK